MLRPYNGFSARGLPLCLLDFADLHVLVYRQDWVADGGIGRRGSVVGDHGEFVAVPAADFVSVAIAFSTGEVYGAGGGKLIDWDALGVGRNVGSFGLCDLVQIHANASKADGLGGSGAGVGSRHFLDGIEVDATNDGGNH